MTDEAKIREAAGILRSVLAWARAYLGDYEKVVPKKQEVLARHQPIFAPEAIPSLTAEEFGGFLEFENNRHWWFPPFHIPSICGDMAGCGKLWACWWTRIDLSRGASIRSSLSRAR
jgi:hypothetical protein